jgi:hypothetical protein
MAGYQCHAPMGLAAHRFNSLKLELRIDMGQYFP